MINRFEDEYPETRVEPLTPTPPTPDLADTAQESPTGSLTSPVHFPSQQDGQTSDFDASHLGIPMSDDEGETLRPALSRHNSDVSLASRALNEEEGRMHRYGQQFRRNILKAETEDQAPGTSDQETEPQHLQMLRAIVEGLGGEELRDAVQMNGREALLNDMSNEARELKRRLKAQDPEWWDKFVESQKAAQRNQEVEGGSESAVVDK